MIKTLLEFEEDGQLYKFDTISYKDQWWIVAGWLKSKARKLMKPTRIILLDSLEHQKVDDGKERGFLLKNPISKSVFFGHIQNISKTEFCVEDSPDIQLPLQE